MTEPGVMLTRLDMQCAIDFGITPDCDCAHEHWHLGDAGTCLDLHLEDDGSCHVILFLEEDEIHTHYVGLTSIDQVRPLAMVWAAPFIGEHYPLAALQPKEGEG